MTYGLGLIIFGVLMAYSGIKNVSIAQAVQGDTNSNPSSAAQLSDIALGGIGNKTGNTPEESSPGNPSGPMPVGVVRPKAPWNPQNKPIAAWIAPLLSGAYKAGWKGTVQSGYRTKAEQAAIYASGVRPAAKPGTSNHEGYIFPRGAVDVSDASGLARALKKVHGGNVLVWAGTKDPVHFSHPHNGSY